MDNADQDAVGDRQGQRLESVYELAGGVAHDFNNLLAGIMNYADLVSASLQEEMTRRRLLDDETFVRLISDVEEITTVARRAAALTDQLLILSHRTVVQPEVLDLNVVLGDIEGLLRTTVGERVNFRTALAADLPSISADRGQIQQVFMNLARNARDAMPAGGDFSIEAVPFEVDEAHGREHAIEPGSYVAITVSDTGRGMPPRVAARALEPFFTTRPRGEGSGLGLATVHAIVTHAGGAVILRSRPGFGTTVRVDLPVASDAKGAFHTKPDATLAANVETVLLVEDDEIVREPVRRILVSFGFTVLTAGDADEALAIVRTYSDPIDLLLTDVVMPGRSGKELSIDVAALRPATKLLFMSGYSHDIIVHEGVLDEGVRLIEKTFSAGELVRKVREVLDGTS